MIALLFGDFLLKLENVIDRYGFSIFANLAGFDDALTLKLIDEIDELLGFILFLLKNHQMNQFKDYFSPFFLTCSSVIPSRGLFFGCS